MPFVPPKLLLAYDDARGLCRRVAGRMREMLEDRAFEVEELVLDGPPPPVSLEHRNGLVLGVPAPRLELRGTGATPTMRSFLDGLDGLDGMKVALFTVHELRRGRALQAFRRELEERGAEVVAAHAYWAFRPRRGEVRIPAECMVRIR